MEAQSDGYRISITPKPLGDGRKGGRLAENYSMTTPMPPMNLSSTVFFWSTPPGIGAVR